MNTRTILQDSHMTVLGALGRLPEDAWQDPGVCGEWSAQDILAHLTSFEQVLVEVLATFLRSAPTPTLDRMIHHDAAFNDDEVAARRHMSPSALMGEFDAAHAEALHLLDQIPLEMRQQNGTLPWYGKAYDLDDFIVYTYYGHAREHSAQIDQYYMSLQERAAAVTREN